MRNINDADRHRTNDDSIKLLLNINWDDFDVKHFTKSQSKNTNMSAVYCCISNVDYKFQSKRNEISLLAIGAVEEIKSIDPNDKMSCLREFFKEIKDQFNQLQTEPIKLINNSGRIYKVEVEIGAVNADNLALNKLLGLTECFHNTQNCPFCTINLSSQNQDAEPRFPEDFDHVFKEFPKTGPIFVFDIFHDLHEGIFFFKNFYIFFSH